MNKSMAMYASIATLVVGAAACAVAPTTGAPEKIVKKEAALGLTDGQNFVYDGWDIPPTQCTVGGVTMHCCEPGKAIIGVRADFDVFKCAALAVAGGEVSLSGLARNGILSCPLGQVAVGFHADLNLLACQTLPGVALNSEVVDNMGTLPAAQDDFPMHVCPADLTMTGLNLDQNSIVPQQPPPPVVTACSVATDSSGTTVQFSNQLTNPSLGKVTFDSTMVRGSTGTLTRTFGMNGNPLYVLQSQFSSDGSFTRSETFFPPITGAANVTSTSDGQTVVYVIDGRQTLPAPVGADPSTVQFADGNPAPQLNVDGAIRDAVAQLLSSAAAAPCLSQPSSPSRARRAVATCCWRRRHSPTKVIPPTTWPARAADWVSRRLLGPASTLPEPASRVAPSCSSVPSEKSRPARELNCWVWRVATAQTSSEPAVRSDAAAKANRISLVARRPLAALWDAASRGRAASIGATRCAARPGRPRAVELSAARKKTRVSPLETGRFDQRPLLCAPVRNGFCCISGSCTTRADCNGGVPNGLNGCDANGCCIIG